MNPDISDIPDRILRLAIGALAQANTHAVYSGCGREYLEYICVLNSAHAGELFLKAIIASEHPLLIFKDIFILDDNKSGEMNIKSLIERGKTHDFERLPQILWAVSGRRIPNPECFKRIRLARNAIQHFCVPEQQNFSKLSLEFIYTVIDPLISEFFGLNAIEYHEDDAIGYDYIVSALLQFELKFTVPKDFSVSEINISDELKGASAGYTDWVRAQLKAIGRLDLLS